MAAYAPAVAAAKGKPEIALVISGLGISAKATEAALMALPPVILLPVGYFVFKERFGWQAILGTLVALAGVGMLFLV